MDLPSSWLEPIVRVQTLSDTGSPVIPDRYIKPLFQRPSFNTQSNNQNIPIIDLYELKNGCATAQKAVMDQISIACREWGFFQVVNHGISDELVDGAREVWKEFFHQPMEMKQDYANTPKTYEGYGSRLGIQKGAILDWSDYFFLHYLPSKLKNHNKWPSQPPFLRYLFLFSSRDKINIYYIIKMAIS
ncbi:putative anthocyanidin synthase [Helianthus anomalus]